MSDENVIRKHTYLLAWISQENGHLKLFFENSTVRIFRQQAVTSAGIVRDDHRVTVFCDFIHGDDYLKKEELQLVATSYLDGDYKTTEIDLRK